MKTIHVLDQVTIDKIAAGEVVERPASVVKELAENAIDAGAKRITIEITDGGIKMIRITDDGGGIPEDQIRLAFMRHATSKIETIDDLTGIETLGFRGEALSSISAVARVELITKPREALSGTRYVIEGGRERLLEEIGAPDGTTFIVRDLFYNTPARAKFLKTAMTEGAHVGSIVEQLALSHPEIAFHFIVNGVSRLTTTGGGRPEDTLYHIFGRNIARELLPVKWDDDMISIRGSIALPSVSRGNRNFENYYVNGRYVKSRVISMGIEDGYGTSLMQHQYPFTCLFIEVDGRQIDVNVHPTKMDVRFSDEKHILEAVRRAVAGTLRDREMIVRQSLVEEKKEPEKKEVKYASPAPFEKNALREEAEALYRAAEAAEKERRAAARAGRDAAEPGRRPAEQPAADMPGQSTGALPAGQQAVDMPRPSAGTFTAGQQTADQQDPSAGSFPIEQPAGLQKQPIEGLSKTPSGAVTGKPSVADPQDQHVSAGPESRPGAFASAVAGAGKSPERPKGHYEQASFLPEFLSKEASPLRRIIGCAFNTYWIVEFGDQLYMIDQHAAHEKVLFTRFMKAYENSEVTRQELSPPMLLTLSSEEEARLSAYAEAFAAVGFEIEPFGGNTWKISAVPFHLSALGARELFTDMLDHLERTSNVRDLKRYILKVATEACKAAVKGGDRLSVDEARALIDELLTCEDPYHCPHGRPTIISFTEKELEKRFRRIV